MITSSSYCIRGPEGNCFRLHFGFRIRNADQLFAKIVTVQHSNEGCGGRVDAALGDLFREFEFAGFVPSC